MSPYEILGVEPSATDADIRAAYRGKAREAHPDRDGGSTTVMSAVNAAYRLLRDPELRKRFDDANAGNRTNYARMRASDVDQSKLRTPVLTLDGWLMPLRWENC